MNKSTIARIALPLLAVLVALVLLEPRTAKWGYDYRKGAQWKYETLNAEFDFPILKTQEEMDAERASDAARVVPYYRYATDITNRHIREAEGLDYGKFQYLRPEVTSAVRGIYEKGVVTDEGLRLDKSIADAESASIYIQKDKRAQLYPASEVYTLSDARARLLSIVMVRHEDINVDSVFRAAGVYELIVPNLSFDAQTTELVHTQTTASVSPTKGYVNAGQLIVAEGEIITGDIYQILDSYKHEYENTVGVAGSRASLWAGNILISIAIMAMFFFFLFFANRDVFLNYNKYLYTLFIFILFAASSLLVMQADENFLFLIPFPLAVLFMHPFFRNRVVVSVYAVMLLPLLVFSQNGVLFYLIALCGGITTLFAFRYLNKGIKQFLSALITFLVEVFVYSGFMLTGEAHFDKVRVAIFLFVGALLLVAGYPLVYIFEKVFALVSTSRLSELSDTSSELLRKLEQRCPGTFQHSLQVMNLASAAARATGANELLVRAGALYHDIGKMNNPQCFVENESLSSSAATAKYHQQITPLQSAQDIIHHVADGVEIARGAKLPQNIIDFIYSHHGTSTMLFFYDKYIKSGGDESEKESFQYHGFKPKTREQVIVMLADSLEAASRTLGDYSLDNIHSLVSNIISAKMKEGQLDDAADFSTKDLHIVEEVFTQYLSQIYHERIAYPKRK